MKHLMGTVAVILLFLGPFLASTGCTHNYILQVSGKAQPGSRIKLSYWTQTDRGVAPIQKPGRTAVADENGQYSLHSKTILDFKGPPSHITMEMQDSEKNPVCVILPTGGLWQDSSQKKISIPGIRPLEPDEKTYELPAKGLSEKIKVIRRDPEAKYCVSPGN